MGLPALPISNPAFALITTNEVAPAKSESSPAKQLAYKGQAYRHHSAERAVMHQYLA